MDSGAWWAMARGVIKRWLWLRNSAQLSLLDTRKAFSPNPKACPHPSLLSPSLLKMGRQCFPAPIQGRRSSDEWESTPSSVLKDFVQLSPLLPYLFVSLCFINIIWMCIQRHSDISHYKHRTRNFPDGSVTKTALPKQGAQVWSLVGELDPSCCNHDFPFCK